MERVRLFARAFLSQAILKMEAYHDLLKSTEAWTENTSRLLANPADYDSSKMLSQHASTLQVRVLSFLPAYGSYTMTSGIAPLRGAAPLFS